MVWPRETSPCLNSTAAACLSQALLGSFVCCCCLSFSSLVFFSPCAFLPSFLSALPSPSSFPPVPPCLSPSLFFLRRLKELLQLQVCKYWTHTTHHTHRQNMADTRFPPSSSFFGPDLVFHPLVPFFLLSFHLKGRKRDSPSLLYVWVYVLYICLCNIKGLELSFF